MDFTYDITFLETTTSTNDEVVARASEGAPQGTVVVAREQEAGRGRLGRSWVSPPGNIYLSILLKPSCKSENLSSLSLLAPLALLRIFIANSMDVRLKWPNDVLLEGKKVSGISLESCRGGVVVGVGINVKQAEPRAEFAYAAQYGFSYERLLNEFLEQFHCEYQAWSEKCSLSEEQVVFANRYLTGEGEEVSVRSRSGEVIAGGKIEGIGDGGELILAHEGEHVAVHSGEVTLREN